MDRPTGSQDSPGPGLPTRWSEKTLPTGGSPSRARRPASALAEEAYADTGGRLYLRWKRSTRPAVSTSFCLPVKKG